MLEANEIKPYFRVNSLFFDPNIYGRFLALTMIAARGVAAVAAARARRSALVAAVLAVLWAGMVLSLSQSSFAALLLGLLVLRGAALAPARWSAASSRRALAVGVVVASPRPSRSGCTPAREGRSTGRRAAASDLIKGGARMARDRPIWGFGSGSFADEFRKRERVHSDEVGGGLAHDPGDRRGRAGRDRPRRATCGCCSARSRCCSAACGARCAPGPPSERVGRAAMAAAYAGLVLHTLVYAAFLEDPLSWVLLALGAALRLSGEARAAGGSPAPEPAQAPEPEPAAA